MINTVKKIIKLACKPEYAGLKIQNKISSYNTKEPAGNLVSKRLQEIVPVLKKENFLTGIILGDKSFYEEAILQAPFIRWTWVSTNSEDLLQGAVFLSEVLTSAIDVIVVGGKRVESEYIFLLRTIKKIETFPRIFWVSEKFEQCFSTLPIPKEIEDADIYFFHHFEAFFQIKDPLLVEFSIQSKNKSTVFYRILESKQTGKISIRDFISDEEGPFVVKIQTTHPVLTRGRHHRWRVTADLFYRNSFTTLHGAHAGKYSQTCQSRLPTSFGSDCKLIVTIPNYDQNISYSEKMVHYGTDAEKKSLVRDENAPIEQITFHPVGKSNFPPFFSYAYNGYGTSFWFGITSESIFSNHESTIAILERDIPLSKKRLLYFEKIEKLGIFFHPHALPVLPPESGLEFGFGFMTSNPSISEWEATFFGSKGEWLGEASFTQETNTPYIFSDEIKKFTTSEISAKTTLIILCPSWKKANLDPVKLNCAGDLALRHRVTKDIDVTEFQSCWRNMGILIPEFPHWIAPINAIISRTKLVGRIADPKKFKTGIAIVNGSGNRKHKEVAIMEIYAHDFQGNEISQKISVEPFAVKMVWFDQLFPNLEEVVPHGGSFLLCSNEIDANAQLVTVSHDNRVSLQHLWGY